MPAGSLYPRSAVPVTTGGTNQTFPFRHVGAGTGSKQEEGLGVQASLGSDAIWRLRFDLPPVLPVGTPRLRLMAIAAPSQPNRNAKVNVKWAPVSVGASPSAASLAAEGTVTLSFGSATADEYNEALIALDALSMAASQIIVMDLTFEAVGWSLNVASTWIPMIIWT